MAGQPLVLPDGILSDSLQEMLVNVHGSALFNSGTIPPPLVAQVKAVEAVIVNPPTMDRETARRLLVEGSAVEAMAGLLFFNPMFHQMLLNRRGK